MDRNYKEKQRYYKDNYHDYPKHREIYPNRNFKEEYNMFYRAAEGRLRPDPSPAERGDAYDFL